MKLTNENFLQQAPSKSTAKTLNIVATVVSVVVVGLVFMMQRISIDLPEGLTLNSLPLVNAIINTSVAISLILAIAFIKQRNFTAHRTMMMIALALSTLFLLVYVAYHITHESVKYGGDYGMIYYPLLISHVILAAVTFPFILFTFIRAFTNQFGKHVKMARWVYPLWLYVAVTGPIVYIMLRPYYPF